MNIISSKKSAIDFLIMLVLVMVSGLATRLFRGVESLLFLFVFSLIYLFASGSMLNKRYIAACMVWIFYILLSMLFYLGHNYFWPFYYICNFTIIYAVVKYFGVNLIEIYLEVIFFLAGLSLVIFSIQIVNPYLIIDTWREYDMSGLLYDKPFTYYSHAFFYTVHQFIDTSKGQVRNAGFAWEPGAFSCFLLIAIYFQLLADKFSIGKSVLRYCVLFLALFSTFSTTGFVGLFVILLWYMSNTSKTNRFYSYLAILVLSIPVLYFIPDQIEKIENELNVDVAHSIYMAEGNENEKSLGRFQSMYIFAADFISNPFIGVGADSSQRWIERNGLSVIPTSGLGNMLATYGLFLMIPFLYILGMSSKLYVNMHASNGGYIFFVLVVICGFSFSLLETPIFLTFIFFQYFYISDGLCGDR